MSVKLGSNISSLTAQRRLAEGTSALSQTFERLSSGQRINKASDDAAGLAISEALKSNQRVFNQGVRNLNDGISALSIADSSIENLTLIVTRLKELAEQAANGTYGKQQRAAIDKEAQSLSDEYTRIVQSTSFNGRKILTADAGKLRLQAGYGLDGSIAGGVGGAVGTGNFQSARTFNASYDDGIIDAQLADLNGDGILDLITTGQDNDSTQVRLGTGNGNFAAALTSSGLVGGRSIDLNDINNDGVLDIVASGIGDTQVALGNGDGTFRTVLSVNSGIATDAKLGDINGDGKDDLVIAENDGADYSIVLRLGNGDGTFGIAQTFISVAITDKLEIADMDQDGILDVISMNRLGVEVWNGGSEGTLTARGTYNPSVSTFSDLEVGDFNGDGINDVAMSDYYAGGSVNVFLGNGSGSFSSFTSFSGTEFGDLVIKAGDMNGDGNLDIVTGGSSSTSNISVHLGDGKGNFASSTNLIGTLNGNVYALDIGDLDQDGVLDIVSSGYMGSGGNSTIDVSLASVTDGVSALLDFNLNSRSDALAALSQFSQKLDQLGKQRGTIGAFQSRIAVATSTLQTSSENAAAAASRITDVDVAEESSRLIRLNILQQASASVLAQANQQPALALTLLR